MEEVEILPTRMLSSLHIYLLGIEPDVLTLLETIGFGDYYKNQYDMYPSLVRELLATCKVTYENPDEPKASEGKFTFFVKKKFYSLAINAICDIYGFPHNEETKFGVFEEASEFWNLIGFGNYVSRGAKITHIRNPVIRLVAKIIGNTFFFQKEPASVKNDALWMLFYGVKHLLSEYADYPPSNVNLGAVLVTEIVKVKTLAPKQCSIGSLLTPIFEYLNVDVSRIDPSPLTRYIDEKHLINCHFLLEHKKYKFWSLEGQLVYIVLPATPYTTLVSRENVIFQPPASLIFEIPNKGRQRSIPSAIRASTSQAADTDEQPPYLLPSDCSQYVPLAAPDADDQVNVNRWNMDVGKKNNEMLRKIWGALAKMTSCACVSRPQVRRNRNVRGPQDAPVPNQEDDDIEVENPQASPSPDQEDDDVEIPPGAHQREIRSKKSHDTGEGSGRPPRRRRRDLGQERNASESSE